MKHSKQNPRQKVQVWICAKSVSQKESYFLILLTRPDRGSFWQPVTGSVEDQESLSAAALREAQEETGLQLDHPPLPIEYRFEFESRGRRVEEYGFSFQITFPDDQNPPLVQIDPHEHVQYKWVSAQEALKTVAFDSNRMMLQTFLSKHSRF